MLGTKAVAQIAVVVKDIAETGKKYAEFFEMELPPVQELGDPSDTNAMYRGNPSEGSCKMMFFQLDNLQIELIEPNGKPSIWQEVLDTQGEGIHHIAFVVKNAKGKMLTLSEKGYKTNAEGLYADKSGMYAYIDTEKDLKLIVELLENF